MNTQYVSLGSSGNKEYIGFVQDDIITRKEPGTVRDANANIVNAAEGLPRGALQATGDTPEAGLKLVVDK